MQLTTIYQHIERIKASIQASINPSAYRTLIIGFAVVVLSAVPLFQHVGLIQIVVFLGVTTLSSYNVWQLIRATNALTHDSQLLAPNYAPCLAALLVFGSPSPIRLKIKLKKPV